MTQILDWIHSTSAFGSVLGLSSIRELLRRLGNPQKNLKVIHVAGTNGKGSVCAMLSSVLIEQGYKTGLYTSPCIHEFRERICVNGQMISVDALEKLGTKLKQVCHEMNLEGLQHPTEFELVTALGFLYFEEQQCDFVVLEVGLGGRLDATNVIDPPLLSVITMIDYDHMDRLGNTLEEIAFEKSGILKQGSRAVTCPGQNETALQVIKQQAEEKHIPLFVASEPEQIEVTLEGTSFTYQTVPYQLSLLGNYQAQNGATALEAIRQLQEIGYEISQEAIQNGLRKVKHMGRLELIRPGLILDGGHNLSGVGALCDFIRRFKQGRKILIVAGMLEDKEYQACGKLLRNEADVLITTQPDNPRKLEAVAFAKCSGADAYEEDPVKAVELALKQAQENDLVIACGSLYLLGPIRSKFLLK